jgi:hypothetical protein
MSAIFISYTGRDPEGDAWADRLAAWFSEWNYGYFRDKDHSHGVKAGDDWRSTLYAELDDATAMVCLCSQQYDSSPWCVGEVAIAVEKGKTVIPIQLATTADELKQEPLPLLEIECQLEHLPGDRLHAKAAPAATRARASAAGRASGRLATAGTLRRPARTVTRVAQVNCGSVDFEGPRLAAISQALLDLIIAPWILTY